MMLQPANAPPSLLGLGCHQFPKSLLKKSRLANLLTWQSCCQTVSGRRETTPVKRRRAPNDPSVTSITEWLQCFCIYMAVVTSKSPDRIQDLLGYLAIIVEACREYEGDTWLGYDRRFRQRAAASPDSKWARIDPTLWNMAFTGHARAERCRYCFSLSHKPVDCEWAPSTSSTTPAMQKATPQLTSKWTPRSRSAPVCKSWNFSLQPSCEFRNCTYQHVCLQCSKDPQAADKGYKLINCPKRPTATSTSATTAAASTAAAAISALPTLLKTLAM